MLSLDHISYSQIDMWDRCPKQWEYRYVKGFKIPPSGALILGSAYHETLEENFKSKLQTSEDIDLSTLADIYDTAWNTRVISEDINWEDGNPDKLKDTGFLLVDTYIGTTAPYVMPIEVEEVYETLVGNTKFVLICDLITTEGAVIDHKTSSKQYTQEDVDKDGQASAVAFALKRPIIFYNHVAVKSRTPRIQTIGTSRSIEDIMWWYSKALTITEHMKTGLAPPREKGWHCSQRFCGYWDVCRGELSRTLFT